MKNQFNMIPPQDLDAERATLASVLLDDSRLDEISGIVNQSMFYLDCHGTIYAAMISLRESQISIDSMTVSSHLERIGKLAEIGGNEYLTKVVESVPHAAHAKFYASEVRDRWTQRMVIYSCTQILSEAYDGRHNGIELAERAVEEIGKLAEQGQENSGKWFKMLAAEAMERHFEDEPEGIPSGFTDLDAMICNWKKQSLYILAARPGMGKTSLASLIAGYWSENSGTVACFSLEMGGEILFDRYSLLGLDTSMKDLRERVRNDPDSANEHFQRLSDLPIFVNASPSQSMASIAAQSRMIKRKHGLAGIVIDHLLLVEPEDKRAPREAQVGLISWRAKQLAKSLDVPVLMLTQLNRECEKRPDKKPVMADLRSSGEIEQNADCVILLYRPAVYFPDKHEDSEAELIIPKNRFGSVGQVNMIWNGPTMTFKGFELESSPDFEVPGDMYFN